MREDTVFGPVWLFPDFLPEKAAKHGVRLELMWPTLEGFTAMHTGPPKGGGWVVRAPMAARRDWEDQERNLRSSLEWTYTHGGQMRPAWMQGKPPPDRTILGDR
jgi:hypothetical protein